MGMILWETFVFNKGGETYGCRQCSEDTNGTAFCGSIVLGKSLEQQFFSDVVNQCCFLWQINLPTFLPLNGAWTCLSDAVGALGFQRVAKVPPPPEMFPVCHHCLL